MRQRRLPLRGVVIAVEVNAIPTYMDHSPDEYHVIFLNSDIRETMIKIILPYTLKQSAARHDFDEEEKLDTVIPARGTGSIVRERTVDPSACTFWCAVAIGALVKGCPVESVSEASPSVL